MLAVDDGLFSGNFDFADFCFLVAVIVFAITFILRAFVRRTAEVSVDSILVAAGFTLLSLGLLVL